MKTKEKKMKKFLLTLFLIAFMLVMAHVGYSMTLNGAGATFPYPVYAQWAYKYEKLRGVKLNYQSIGSGGGIAQIKAKTVDFGASDAPMRAEELKKYNLFQFPMIMGGVVPVIHIKGVSNEQMKLCAKVLANIFLGKIRKWNDPAIRKLNPGIALPDREITVVHRADGSGTTWIFTNYLDKISKEWHKKVGTGKAVSWPTGVGGKGNEGVSAYVQKVNGAIGYVEFAYALQNGLTTVRLENRAGRFVAPTIRSFQSAAAHADWAHAPGFYMVLTDQPGPESWPITGASFILIYRVQTRPNRARAMLTFFDWAYRHGAGIAKKLGYVPMPEKIVKLVEEAWKENLKDTQGNPLWK